MSMIDKIRAAEENFRQIEEKIALPEVIGDPALSRKMMKEYKRLHPIALAYREYLSFTDEIEDLKILQEDRSDPELAAAAREELILAQEKLEGILEQIKILLLPKDENDDKNVIVEIRAGAGGEEAALFVGVLFRMYSMYAQSCEWRVEVISSNETELGGYKEISFSIEGALAYSKMKFESGVHRVQRVPETESQGRIQTSTATVAVLPEAEEVEVEINPQDLEIDTHRASGAGGQHVNKTDSAIRILHKPTGIVVECQDERSQLKNKEKAMKVLRSKLYQAKLSAQNDKISSERKNQIGTGDRSERIRTYNYPQGRVSDHRISLTLHSLESILNGRLNEIFDALQTAERIRLLERSDFS